MREVKSKKVEGKILQVKSKKPKVKSRAVPRSFFDFCLFTFAFCLFSFTFLLLPFLASAQSSDQNFPTHVTSNEINGRIAARNIGDARLTTYFYLFEGSQGDIFINVATTNFSGDIDIYAADSMKPLTKMVMYADTGSSETGRLIYLRQSARLMLRIEGRTPNDAAATYRIKFAGSFVALAPETYEAAPTVAKRESGKSSESGKSVESVESKTEDQRPKTEDQISEDPKPKTEDQSSDTVFENKSAKVTVKPAPKPTTTKRRTTTARTAKPKPEAQKPKTKPPKPEPPPDPLTNVKLVVVFKDGTVLERPMTEIVRFSFDNGRLTIIEKNGTITRYQMTTIAKVTIE